MRNPWKIFFSISQVFEACLSTLHYDTWLHNCFLVNISKTSHLKYVQTYKVKKKKRRKTFTKTGYFPSLLLTFIWLSWTISQKTKDLQPIHPMVLTDTPDATWKYEKLPTGFPVFGNPLPMWLCRGWSGYQMVACCTVDSAVYTCDLWN